MPQDLSAGDFLIFQLESGFGLLRVLDREEKDGDTIWHLAAYRDLFLDVDSAENAVANPDNLTIELPHVALTNRAFESTQVAKIADSPLDADHSLNNWKAELDGQIHDRSIRLLLGLR